MPASKKHSLCNMSPNKRRRDAASLKATKRRRKCSKTHPLDLNLSSPLPTADTTRRLGGAVAVLKIIRRTIRALYTGYRVRLYHEIARAYATANIVAEDEAEWANLCADKFWEDFDASPNERDRADAFRWVALRAVASADRASRQRASKLYCALQPLFEAGVGAAQVPDRIREAGGIEKMARANAEGRREPDDQRDDNHDQNNEDNHKGSNKTHTKRRPKQHKSKNATSTGNDKHNSLATDKMVVLVGKLTRGGRSLLKFKPPCRVSISVDLQERKDMAFRMKILGATRTYVLTGDEPVDGV
jgi:hypothetical protein